MNSIYINLFVASTNIVGLVPLIYIYTYSYILALLICVMVITSTLMHISERKHNLKGIPPFNKYSNLFLNMDRLCAIICAIITMYLIYEYNIPIGYILFGVIGLLCVSISELTNNQILFAVLHSVWHIVAYTLLYFVLVYIYS